MIGLQISSVKSKFDDGPPKARDQIGSERHADIFRTKRERILNESLLLYLMLEWCKSRQMVMV